MSFRLLLKRILPFAGLCLGFAIATIALDAALHTAGLTSVGRYLGIPGTLLILISLSYSLRKRGKISLGTPRGLLKFHEWVAWVGASLILVHAGVHFEAVLPWMATAAMGVNVLSGLTGKFLLASTREDITERRRTLEAAGVGAAEIEDRLFSDLATMRIMNRWRMVHIPIFLTFAITALGHIASILLFWNWK
ncbi:MAG: hypothetical protein EBT64_05335 [Gammaproteobacteria bacterium]|jgi:hypothetical protein|nr:hypothetical protein [Gammaproteobacteria bacterium]